MPPMQLSTLVLPAPLGPISANSSAGSTASDTPSSTVRPPKRRLKPSMSSSAIPSPAAAVFLDGAVAAPLAAARLGQIELLHVGVAAQALAVAVEHDAAVLHDVTVVGNAERYCGALLHQHDGGPEFLADLQQALGQVLHHDRRQAEG